MSSLSLRPLQAKMIDELREAFRLGPFARSLFGPFGGKTFRFCLARNLPVVSFHPCGGLLAGVAGVVTTSRAGASVASAGVNFELDAIAAAFIESASRVPSERIATFVPSRRIRPLPISRTSPRSGSSTPTPSPRG